VIDDWDHSGFGWRVWYLNDAGRLQSIFLRDAACWSVGSGRPELVLPAIEGRDSRGRYVEAQCPHGNRVPSAGCLCGVHFIPSLEQCVKWAAIAESGQQTEGRWAFTFGVAAGLTDADGSPAMDPFRARRAHRYYPLAIAVPETHALLVDSVLEHYRVLVTASTSADRLRILERGVRAKLKVPEVPEVSLSERAAVLAKAIYVLSSRGPLA
jgi:hypothetical protein